jgi:hypothetical protein
MIDQVWDMTIDNLVRFTVVYGDNQKEKSLLDTVPVVGASTPLLSNDITLGAIDTGEEGGPMLITYLKGGFLLSMSVPLYPLMDKEWWRPIDRIPACVSHNMQDALQRLKRVGYMGAATGNGAGGYPCPDDMSAFDTRRKSWTS